VSFWVFNLKKDCLGYLSKVLLAGSWNEGVKKTFLFCFFGWTITLIDPCNRQGGAVWHTHMTHCSRVCYMSEQTYQLYWSDLISCKCILVSGLFSYLMYGLAAARMFFWTGICSPSKTNTASWKQSSCLKARRTLKSFWECWGSDTTDPASAPAFLGSDMLLEQTDDQLTSQQKNKTKKKITTTTTWFTLVLYKKNCRF